MEYEENCIHELYHVNSWRDYLEVVSGSETAWKQDHLYKLCFLEVSLTLILL